MLVVGAGLRWWARMLRTQRNGRCGDQPGEDFEGGEFIMTEQRLGCRRVQWSAAQEGGRCHLRREQSTYQRRPGRLPSEAKSPRQQTLLGKTPHGGVIFHDAT
jgi:hypothetical protein